MSLHPLPIFEVPEETARIAQAAFPKGNIYTGRSLKKMSKSQIRQSHDQKSKEKQQGRDKTLKIISNCCFHQHLSNYIQATDPIHPWLSQLQVGIERCG